MSSGTLEMNFPITSSEDYDDRRITFEFAVMVFVYTSVLAVFLMVIALLLKLMGFCDGGAVAEGGIATESSGLVSKEAATKMYGVFEEEDEELGTCGRSSSNEDLFEGKDYRRRSKDLSFLPMLYRKSIKIIGQTSMKYPTRKQRPRRHGVLIRLRSGGIGLSDVGRLVAPAWGTVGCWSEFKEPTAHIHKHNR
nr:E3 ubiquitin-protein ligase SPL1-like [Ipomoea batatas]